LKCARNASAARLILAAKRPSHDEDPSFVREVCVGATANGMCRAIADVKEPLLSWNRKLKPTRPGVPARCVGRVLAEARTRCCTAPANVNGTDKNEVCAGKALSRYVEHALNFVLDAEMHADAISAAHSQDASRRLELGECVAILKICAITQIPLTTFWEICYN
jgi:hypothetical protein